MLVTASVVEVIDNKTSTHNKLNNIKNNKLAKGIFAVMLVMAIMLIDQWIKLEVKTTMTLHESREVTSWFYITFIENKGMAYGMSFINKPVLSLFRLAAIIVIGIYLYRQVRQGARWIYVTLLSMVLAGAAGNLIDCMFYGLCFTESTPFSVAYVVPFGEGYAEFLTGKVVDMFYFPLIVTQYPDWFPLYGGQEFIFFSPVFNFADASISTSVVCLLLFCHKELAALEGFRFGKHKAEATDSDEAK